MVGCLTSQHYESISRKRILLTQTCLLSLNQIVETDQLTQTCLLSLNQNVETDQLTQICLLSLNQDVETDQLTHT